MKKENKLCRTECFGAKPEARQKKKGNRNKPMILENK